MATPRKPVELLFDDRIHVLSKRTHSGYPATLKEIISMARELQEWRAQEDVRRESEGLPPRYQSWDESAR